MLNAEKPVVFFGLYLQVLKTLATHNQVQLVVLETRCNEDAIKNFCREQGIRWVEIKELDELAGVLDVASEPLGVVASFGLLFKKRHISWFKSLFNFHPGCIRTNRGRHPLPNAIRNGFKSMSITVHQITDERIDAGRFVSRIEFSIDYASNYRENCLRLLSALDFLTKDLCAGFDRGVVPSFEFIPARGSYFKALTPEDLTRITEAPNLMEWRI